MAEKDTIKDDEIKEEQEPKDEQQEGKNLSFEEQLNELKRQIEELNSRFPAVDEHLPTEAETALTERERALFQRQIQLELKAEGLEEFADFIHAENEEQLMAQVAKLKELKGKLKADNSYKPSEYNASSDYAKAKKNKDVRSMIRTKF